MNRKSDLLEEEIAAIQRELDDEELQEQKQEELTEGQYAAYLEGLESRIERLQEEYEDAISKGL